MRTSPLQNKRRQRAWTPQREAAHYTAQLALHQANLAAAQETDERILYIELCQRQIARCERLIAYHQAKINAFEAVTALAEIAAQQVSRNGEPRIKKHDAETDALMSGQGGDHALGTLGA